MDIRDTLYVALDTAMDMKDEGDSTSSKHRNRSKNFVDALDERLRIQYQASMPSCRVLSKHNEKNRAEFGLNELLFDVLVCDTATTTSYRGSAELTYVTKAIWAIESELARDSRQALFDFNKLVIAASDYKLFICSQAIDGNDDEEFLSPLLSPALHCSGSVFVAFIPHPSGWETVERSVRLYKLSDGFWRNA